VWDDLLTTDTFDLSGSAWGWGLNFSSNLKFGQGDVLRLQLVYGEGIENYMNDSPVDVGIARNPGNTVRPVKGDTLPIVGTVIFLDHQWNEKWSSTVGYSNQNITNSDGQAPDAFHAGHYALGNLLYSPVANVMMGGEFQWGRRVNFSDHFQYDGYKMQFSFKYNFSHRLGG
jgi:nucleoside-specific outer membrane channel protein Tsx